MRCSRTAFSTGIPGAMVNANLEQYKIAGAARDAAIEVVHPGRLPGPQRHRRLGIAEPANVADRARRSPTPFTTPSACALRELPMTPARVLGRPLAQARTGGAPMNPLEWTNATTVAEAMRAARGRTG